jgi:hypothetical protein
MRTFVTTLGVAAALVMAGPAPAAGAATWTVQSTPNPPGGGYPTLRGVSCTSANACVAAGYVQSVAPNGSVFLTTLAESWNGQVWTIRSTPNLPGGGALEGVSCASTTACIAVGARNQSFDQDGYPKSSRTLAERWDGHRWTIQSTPNSTRVSALAAVSCRSSNVCMAVGAGRVGSPSLGSGATLAERWNGHKWTILPTPSQANTVRHAGEFVGVSCVSSRACIAVQEGESSERWNGKKWSFLPTPPIGNRMFTGVSCTSATACIAVGRVGGTTLAKRWNGHTWTTQSTPSVHGSFHAVSCPSANACVAVGGEESQNQGQPATILAESWDGRAWTIQPTPDGPPPGGAGASVDGVSCTSATACTAVGHGLPPLPPVHPGPPLQIHPETLAERYG